MTEKEYDAALTRIDQLMNLDPEPGTDEAEELESLMDQVERYEEWEEDE